MSISENPEASKLTEIEEVVKTVMVRKDHQRYRIEVLKQERPNATNPYRADLYIEEITAKDGNQLNSEGRWTHSFWRTLEANVATDTEESALMMAKWWLSAH